MVQFTKSLQVDLTSAEFQTNVLFVIYRFIIANKNQEKTFLHFYNIFVLKFSDIRLSTLALTIKQKYDIKNGKSEQN